MGKREEIKRAIAGIIDKHQAEYESTFGVTSSEEKRDLARREFELLRTWALGNFDYNAEHLSENLRNKLTVSMTERSQPSDYWWQPTEDEGISSALAEIIEELEKQTRTRSKLFWKVVKYILSGLREVVYLAVVILVIDAAKSKFETIVYCLLALIYNVASGARSGVGWTTQSISHQLTDSLGDIARELKLKVPAALRVQSLKAGNEAGIHMIIHSIGLGIGTLTALWHLVGTLL